MVRVAVVVTARPSWAKLQPVCEALQARPDIDLQVIACASALLERYGRVVDVIRAQGFPVAAEVYSVFEGESLLTSAKETGALLSELASVLRQVRPDLVLVCADRHEVLACAQAAAYQHIPLAHLQGGERTGSIDDKVRDSITALADYHFPATERAAFRVLSLTGAYGRIWQVGCPSIDVAKRAQDEPPVTVEELGGAGVSLDDYREQGALYPGALILQHPVTSEADEAYEQMRTTLNAVLHASCPGPVVALWPGQDAGAAGASKALREYQDVVHTVRNLPPNRFLRLLTQAAVLVGNSSAGIRECSYLGVPVVNVGTRQQGRERGGNVIDVPHHLELMTQAIRAQVAHGRYPSQTLYGAGDAGPRMAEVCAYVSPGTHPSPVRI